MSTLAWVLSSRGRGFVFQTVSWSISRFRVVRGGRSVVEARHFEILIRYIAAPEYDSVSEDHWLTKDILRFCDSVSRHPSMMP